MRSLSGPFVHHLDTVIEAWDDWPNDADNNSHQPILKDVATLFISYTGAYTLDYLIIMLRQVDPNEYIWLDIFCVDQFAWTGRGRSPQMAKLKLGR